MAGENAKVHQSQNPDVQTVENGGAIDIRTGGKILANGTQAAAIAQTTDSTGGTAGDTIAAITAGGSYAQADLTAIKNGLASLTAKLNALQTACKGAGIIA